MIKDVSNVRVFSMLEVENRIVYTIPRYQREYTWGKSEWDAFFDDLMESEPGYFLGSIICIDQPSKTFGPRFLELVDGQQRVTTISVLLAVLYQRLSEIVDSSDDELRLELMTLKYRLVLKGNKNQPRLVPQIQNNNQQDYFALLQQANLLEDIETVPHAGNRRLFKAFRHFSSRLSSLKQGVATDTSTLMSVLEKVINATMVIIEVASHADAYTLFESLNNRGVPLTAVDLIKNKVLAELERKDTGNIDKHYNRWKKIIDALGDDYSVQERFFRQYYNAFKSELKSVVSVPVATKSNLMHLYEC